MPSIEQQIKEGFDNVSRTWEEFKKENDVRLKRLEDRGHNAGDREEKLANIEKAMDQKSKEIEELKTAVNRMNQGGDDGKQGGEIEKKAFASYMRSGEKKLSEAELKALAVGSDPDGGYLVRPEVSAEITKKIFESSPVRQFADVVTISTDSFEEAADFDDADASWVGEKATRSATETPELQMLRIPTHEIYAKPKATQKILEDAAVDIEAWLQGKVVDKFARKEATAFISGDGVNQPRGILTYQAGDAWGKVEQVASGSAAAVTADGFIETQNALFEAFQANARWMMRRATLSAVRKLKTGAGEYLFSLDASLANAFGMLILGKPVTFAADMPAVGANELAVIYGDFRQGYKVVDRVGISVLRDQYSAKPYIEFYTRKRVGGGVKNFQALKIMKIAAAL